MFSPGVPTIALLAVVCLVLIRKCVQYQRLRAAIRHWPGRTVILDSVSLIGRFLPRIPGFNTGPLDGWATKHSEFERNGYDAFSCVSLFPIQVEYQVADPRAIKEVMTSRERFIKVPSIYKQTAAYGPQLVASEGLEWKRFRKASAPAFGEQTIRLAWDEATSLAEQMSASWGQQAFSVSHVVDWMMPLTLYIIANAAFGQHVEWKPPPNYQSDTDSGHSPQSTPLSHGHTLTYVDAMSMVSTYLPLKVIIPSWILRLSKKGRAALNGFKELEAYISEMIWNRRRSKQEQYDLFSTLLAASESESTFGDKKETAKLTDPELLSNMFIFQIAGHETTAHALSVTLGLLALYPDEQEKCYEQIKEVLSDGRVATYEDMRALKYPLACFYEALRLFPPAPRTTRVATEDTTLPISPALSSSSPAETGIKTRTDDLSAHAIVVPAGSYVTLNFIGLHHNPRFWPEPLEFRPSRFLGDWNRDAFMSFSSGHRGCIGRRFAEAEAVAVLTHILAHYVVKVNEDVFKVIPGESRQERENRLLAARQGATITPIQIPITFEPR